MPITKFSWASLKENIRKFGAIYLVGILVTLACTNLIWTMTRPRVPTDQSITIYIADSYSNPEGLDDIAAKMLEAGKELESDLQEVVFYSLSYGDPTQDYTGSMVLATRLATGESDAFICNEFALANLQSAEAALNLEPYLDNGWLEGLDVEPVELEFYDVDVDGTILGVKDKYIGAIKLDNVDELYNRAVVDNEGTYLVIATNGENIETTVAAVDVMLRALMEE